jgi:hypothetical protein
MATSVARVSPLPPIIAIYIQEIGRIEADPQGAAATAPWPGAGRDRLHAVVGHERRQMRLETDRPHARAAAAMRDAEGLVQVHVADVGADQCRRGQSDLRVEVGAVHVDLAAMLVHDGADIRTASSKTPCVDG